MFKDVWIPNRVFYSVPLVLLSALMPVPGCFQYRSSVVEFEVRDCGATEVLLLYSIVLAILFFFPYEIE